MKAEGGHSETEADGEPVLAVGLATAPAEDHRQDLPAELVAVELAGTLPLLPVPQPLLSVPAPETDVVSEIAAPPVVEEPEPRAVPAELVAVELAMAMPLLPVPLPLLSVPAPETEVMTEIAAPPTVAAPEAPVVPAEPVVVAEAPVVPAEQVVPAEPVVVAESPAPPPEAHFAGQAERVSWLRRLRSLIALIFLAALLGATLAAVVIGIGVLIALAAQHALG